MPGRFKEGDTVMAHSRGCIYEAKVLRADPANPSSYYIHFQGWGKRYDEWVADDKLLEFTPENVALAKAVNEEMKAAAERKSEKKADKGAGADGKGAAAGDKGASKGGKKEESSTPAASGGAAASGAASGGGARGRKRKFDPLRDTVSDEGSGAETAPVKFSFPWLIKRLVVEDWDMVSQKRFLAKVPREVPAATAPTAAAAAAASGSTSPVAAAASYAYQPHTVRSLCDLYLWSVARGGWGSHGVEPAELSALPKAKKAKKAAAASASEEGGAGAAAGAALPPLPSASAAAGEVLAALAAADAPPALRAAKEVVDGLRLYFDRCLSVHLLFRFEFLQYNVVAASLSQAGAAATTPMSAVYGPEHLLRLFVKLPELLAAGSVNAEDGDTIVAVVNDMMKFIVKYHTLFFSTGSGYSRAKKEYVAAFENSITQLGGGASGGGGSGAGLSGLPRLTMADLFEAPAATEAASP